jgi:hypothetical protein
VKLDAGMKLRDIQLSHESMMIDNYLWNLEDCRMTKFGEIHYDVGEAGIISIP